MADGWMASPTQWTWVWVDSGSWWWTGRPGVLQSMGSQRIRHGWATELNFFENRQHTLMLVLTYNGWCYNEGLVYDSYFLSGKLRIRDILVTIKVTWAVVLQSLHRVQLCQPMDCSAPGFLVLHHLPEFTQTHVRWVGDAIQHLVLYHPLLLPPSIFPSFRVIFSESALFIRWPKYWSFSFGISPSNEHSGLISSRIDWFDLL